MKSGIFNEEKTVKTLSKCELCSKLYNLDSDRAVQNSEVKVTKVIKLQK